MKCSIICMIFLAFAAIKEVESKCGCRVRYKVVGCYNDKRSDRALPNQLVNERDRYSTAYNGYNVDWYNWDEYLPAFTCRCAEAAMKKGYKLFGLQYWGECWSGPSPSAAATYDKHGKGNACYGLGYKKCTSASDNCVGDNHHNFIYEIETYDCPVKFERLGCYDDDTRPLSDYILTDRDTRHAMSSGIAIDWYNFDTYLPDLACRCAQVAMEKEFNTFGVQYYGECWSGADGDEKYYKDGASTSCVNQCYEQCRSHDPFCTGKGYTNFVYRITKDVCELNYTSLGCYKENTESRLLDKLILDDVNPQSPKFSGLIATDFNNWEKYMEGLICRCARKIKEHGYTTFGITNGGQCWSGTSAENTFESHGASEECYFDKTTPCTGTVCAGGESTSYIYQLESEEENNTA